jgi:hypothetical protein
MPERVQPILRMVLVAGDPCGRLELTKTATVQVRQRFDVALAVREDERQFTLGACIAGIRNVPGRTATTSPKTARLSHRWRQIKKSRAIVQFFNKPKKNFRRYLRVVSGLSIYAKTFAIVL